MLFVTPPSSLWLVICKRLHVVYIFRNGIWIHCGLRNSWEALVETQVGGLVRRFCFTLVSKSFYLWLTALLLTILFNKPTHTYSITCALFTSLHLFNFRPPLYWVPWQLKCLLSSRLRLCLAPASLSCSVWISVWNKAFESIYLIFSFTVCIKELDNWLR